MRNPDNFAVPSVNSIYYGFKVISNIGPRIWKLVPDRIKELNSITAPSKMKLKDDSLKSVRIGYVIPVSLALVFCNTLQIT